MPGRLQRLLRDAMKRTLLLYALLAALLIVAIRHFELSMFAGQVPMKLFITVIGALFLGLGIFAGMRFRRKQVEKEVVVQYVEKPGPPPAVVPDNDVLSARESEVLLHIAGGLTNREIAERLFVSENTIKTHINNIYSKLGVRRRTQAVSRAKEMKLIA